MNEEQNKESPQSNDDNQQQEPQLNTHSTDEPIATAETSDIINPPSDIKDMEVHHHAHDPAAPHHKKNWKSYFWEFLMLFLAVFCGFMAEYQLEHKIERDREKKFIQTFIEDLKVDTATIRAQLAFRHKKINQIDSLIYFFREQKIKGYENDLYYLGRLMVRSVRFQSSDRTITQLKFSGSLRLIRNENAADSIIAYQKVVDYITINLDDDRAERRAIDPFLAKIFNPFVFDKMLDEWNNINKPTDNPPLRSYDHSLQQDLAYYVNQIKGSNIQLITRLKLLNEKAINTIAFLQKEYHLE
ncbi:MAG: hypothetical protein KA160_02470 [Lacibacter sp.]|nr:hypothetical protein [Lacibacter sp.]